MTSAKDMAALDFGGPATYRIVIQGAVGENWRDRLGGMVITTSNQETGGPQTTLRGQLLDQASLHGLLEIFYALHLPILEVVKVDARFALCVRYHHVFHVHVSIVGLG